MADSNTGGSEENENWKFFLADLDPTDFSVDEYLENHPPDQETTDPEQSLHQGFDPPAGPNGCLPEPSIYQGPNQAAASTQRSIAQQHSGQLPEICTGNPSQIPESLRKKREYDRKYREKQKKQKQELVEGNERLEREKHEFEEQMKSKLDAFEAENRRLKREKLEKREFEEQMKSILETGFKHVGDEVNSLRRDNATELAKLGNKVDTLLELKQQNTTIRKRRMFPTEEFWTQSQEEDSFNSAKKFRIRRRSQMPTYKRKASSVKRERKSAMKNLKAGFQRLKAEMQEISKEQQSIKEAQKQVRKKFEDIEAECAQLRKETDLMIRQSAATRLTLALMFRILRAREDGNLLEATRLTQLLRTILSRQNEQWKGSI
ncbi:hypothetical protein SLEP1_g21229 [Rubroshorea leprosula]|uniref:BZIP domain-containing protein n=1 Tax=Rubroshorea leprosula TaxID=152421 RepID=A0AAV5JEI8_9ROSI|nr:hypothetical protein SLEP1_g21229 [Rubroshorea leprosula]